MASPHMPELVELRRFNSRDLDAVLAEEGEEWKEKLFWDFSDSANSVRDFANRHTLDGLAVVQHPLADPAFLLGRAQPNVVGYGYTVLEDRKGLIGDAYIGPRAHGNDGGTRQTVRLFKQLLDRLISQGARRVESQLMISEPVVAETIQRSRFVQLYERVLMVMDTERPLPAGAKFDPARFHVEYWGPHYEDPISGLIERAYRHHVDARINDQYLSFAGAKKFLHNIVTYPGCGTFSQVGSMVAFDQSNGWLSGLVLASFVDRDVAHITQLCVAPHLKGSGVGYELLRRAVGSLRAAGAARISLSVTASNLDALRLYERCGFSEVRRFFALVWEPVL